MSTLPTSEEMSWLFSSPGSVLAMATCSQHRRVALDDAELARCRRRIPRSRLTAHGRHDAVEVAARNAVFASRGSAPSSIGVEQAQRRLVDRRALDRVERARFSISCFSRSAIEDLPPPTGPEQIEDLLLLFEALRGVPEEGDDLLDRVFHAVELARTRGRRLMTLLAKMPRQARVVAGVDQFAARRSPRACARRRWRRRRGLSGTAPDTPPATSRPPGWPSTWPCILQQS